MNSSVSLRMTRVEARESIAVKCSGPDMAIVFNPEYLGAPFRNLDADEIHLELIDEVSPGVIVINTSSSTS